MLDEPKKIDETVIPESPDDYVDLTDLESLEQAFDQGLPCRAFMVEPDGEVCLPIFSGDA